MVTIQEAAKIVKQNLFDGDITAAIRWEDNWLFAVYTSDPDEGQLDPFYAVNVNTGAFSGFSIVGDQDTAGILEAFSQAVEHTDYSDDFLAHYGVKGMKWGVRRSKEELSRGKKASIAAESASNVLKPIAGPFIPRASVVNTMIRAGQMASQSVPMKVALKSATTSPVALAGYAVTGLDSGAYRVPVVAAKNAKRGGWNKDKSLAKKNMSQDEIQKKVVSGINKDYPGLGTTNNCLRCTYAYEMRRRGNDVAATKTALASGQTALGPKVMTKSLSSKTKIKASNPPTGIKALIQGKRPTEADVFRTLAKQPERSRGDFQMNWGMMLGGHSIAYEIINSRPVFFDTQSGKTYSTPAQLRTLTERAQSMSFNRLDNKDLNDFALTAWLKDVKD